MQLEQFIANLADVFEETDPSDLTAATEFKKLDEWSSLTALSIIAMVDEEYDVALKGDDIVNATTVEDLFNAVQGKL